MLVKIEQDRVPWIPVGMKALFYSSSSRSSIAQIGKIMFRHVLQFASSPRSFASMATRRPVIVWFSCSIFLPSRGGTEANHPSVHVKLVHQISYCGIVVVALFVYFLRGCSWVPKMPSTWSLSLLKFQWFNQPAKQQPSLWNVKEPLYKICSLSVRRRMTTQTGWCCASTPMTRIWMRRVPRILGSCSRCATIRTSDWNKRRQTRTTICTWRCRDSRSTDLFSRLIMVRCFIIIYECKY